MVLASSVGTVGIVVGQRVADTVVVGMQLVADIVECTEVERVVGIAGIVVGCIVVVGTVVVDIEVVDIVVVGMLVSCIVGGVGIVGRVGLALGPLGLEGGGHRWLGNRSCRRCKSQYASDQMGPRKSKNRGGYHQHHSLL